MDLALMTQAQLQETANIPAHGVEPSGNNWRTYFSFSTDHKVIGIQYLVTTFIFYLIGGALATAVRTELATPRSGFCEPRGLQQSYSRFTRR
jgi:cytochrome c oxidase subunit 1